MSGPAVASGDGAGTSSAGNNRSIYLATYSNVAVFEFMVRGIACMRRRKDGYINATQILKIAGIDKARRTKILEREILTGEHEKVQGGYGKYQGTWIPLKRAQELSATYNVVHLLAPLLEFDPSKAGNVPVAGPRKRPNPNAPSASMYYRTGPGAAQLAAAKGAAAIGPGAPVNGLASLSTVASAAASASPSAAPGSAAQPAASTPDARLQPRFLTLRPPPAFNPSPSASPSSYPRGSTAEQRAALSGYSSYGYTPQGVPLPPPNRDPSEEAGRQKRGADALSNEDVDGEHDAKRTRLGTQEGGPAVNGVNAAASLSPVKDLNALGSSMSPTSALRGARAPARSGRVALGPPDSFKAMQLDGTRFADRPFIMQDGNDAERNVRAKILELFASDRMSANDDDEQSEFITPNDERKLDDLLIELRQASSGIASDALAQQNGSINHVNGRLEPGKSSASVDLVIDDHGHTALHWASALAKLNYVRMLVAKSPSSGGANTHAGNHGGETALHRAVLVSNSYEQSAFPVLLRLLAPSLHTRDYRKRTVLHHIALVSHIRGRSVAARYYLACVLEYIDRHQGARYASLVDAQDDEGETALSIVARNGNANMVKMLLEVGARKDIVNSLGLKASDWGIDGMDAGPADESGPAKEITPNREKSSEIVSSLTRPPRAPVQKSKDVLEQMTTVLSDLADVFQKELGDKTEAFNVAQTHLQSATRELAQRRRKIAEGQSNVAQRDQAHMRRQNLAKVLREEMGAAEEEDEAKLVASCLTAAGSEMQVDELTDAGADSSLPRQRFAKEAPFKLKDSVSEKAQDGDALVKLRWLAHWYTSSCDALEARIASLDAAASDRLAQCRRVVAMCCGVPEARVEDMLEELVLAIESIGSEGIDLQRLAGFLSKVKPSTSTGA